MISLVENPILSDAVIEPLDDFFPVWQHTIKDVGGCWNGDGAFVGSPAQTRLFFLTNLGRRITVGQGGITWYEGQIVRLEYTHRGQTFVRTMEDLANRTKVLYTKVGNNLLTNGDVEGGAWAAVGAPSTIETTTSWFARGTTAMHCVTLLPSDGMVIQASVAITASKAYVCSVIINVVSGTWTLTVDDTAGNVISQRATSGTGREWLQCRIQDSNTVTPVRVLLTGSAGSVEIYADGAILRSAPVRAETKWYEDTDSIALYGRIEGIFLEGEMTDTESDSMAVKYLAEQAWARTLPPESGGGSLGADSLIVTTMGLVNMLTWRHALTDGTDQADNHVTALLDESEKVPSSSALIDTNTTEVLIESNNPITLWRALEKVIESGDGSGAPWTGGVYPGYQFRYSARPTGLQYEYTDGMLRYYGGGTVKPLEVVPGWCLMSDMPQEPRPAESAAIDDPRRVWLSEITYRLQDGYGSVEWAR